MPLMTFSMDYSREKMPKYKKKKKKKLLYYETDMCLISFLHILTADLQCHNRQLIIIHQVGCACFPFGLGTQTEKVTQLSASQPAPDSSNNRSFFKARCSTRHSPKVSCESHWTQRIKDQKYKYSVNPGNLAPWLGFNNIHSHVKKKD